MDKLFKEANYKYPHFVIIVFSCKEKMIMDNTDFKRQSDLWERYYNEDLKDGILLFKGKIMNSSARLVCISVQADTDFERIINADPSINEGGLFEISAVIPFATNFPQAMAFLFKQ